MTKIKLCGLKRREDIECANELKPDFIGFVFAKKSRRFVTKEDAAGLKGLLNRDIKAVGVFIDEECETVADLLNEGIIDVAQLHGNEDEKYIEKLRCLTESPIIKAFKIKTLEDIQKANASTADYVLLDSGAGGGTVFDWSFLKEVKRPYFLAGGLNCENAGKAVKELKPFALDVSSGIETDGVKDSAKMNLFVTTVREL